MPQQRKRSILWDHFKHTEDGKALCNYCSKYLGIRGGSTGNLGRHLRKKHPGINFLNYSLNRRSLENVEIVTDTDCILETVECNNVVLSCEVKNNETSCIELETQPQDSGVVVSTVQNSDTCQDNYLEIGVINKLVVNTLVKGHHTFSMVDEPDFRNMIHTLCPGYNIPDKKTIKYSLVPHMYSSAKELVKLKISEVSSFCITTDSWKSSYDNVYMTITAHYIADDSEINSSLLDCITLCDQYTVDDLTNALQKVFTDWEISEKISVVITDKGQGINNWEHIPCFLYLIDVVVKAGLIDIRTVVNKVRNIIKGVRSENQNNLRDKQISDPDHVKLKLDISSNWMSTYDMLSRMLQLKDLIISVSHEKLSSNEWTIVQQSVSILAVFNEIANEIITEKIVPVSKVVVYINAMKKHVAKNYENQSNEITSLLCTLMFKINEHLKDFEDNEFIMQTILLDPRFKKYGFSNIANYQLACSSLRMKVNCVEIETPVVLSNAKSTNDTQNSSLCWNDFDQEVNKVMTIQNYRVSCTREVDKYLDEFVISRSENQIAWWRDRKLLYPTLYEIAKARLCILAASITGEHTLTKQAKALYERRKYLSPSTVAEILFLSANT